MVAFLKQIVQECGNDKIGQLSAAFSYFTLFSIGPLLLVILSVASFVLGDDAVNGVLATQLSGTLGPEAAETIQNVVANSHRSSHNVLGLVVGLVSLLLAASGLFGQLQTSFNQIFKVQADGKSGIKGVIRHKINGVILLGIVCLLVLASIVASALIAGLNEQLHQRFGVPSITLELFNFASSALIIGLLLGLLYKSLADVVMPWRIAISAGIIVGLLFSLGKTVLGFVIGSNGAASAYGAAAALITLLLWVFYFGQIIFMGAEGIKVYGDLSGRSYVAKKNAVKQKGIQTLVGSPVKIRIMEAFQRGFNRRPKK